MGILVAHLTSEPVWEVKCGFALHQWQCAEHVDALRRRIGEMRSPAPRLDTPPEHDETAGALEAFLREVDASEGTVELLVGIYAVALPALAEAYRQHLAFTNPLVDHPTRRLMRIALMETEEAVEWGMEALGAGRDALSVERGALGATADWEAHLRSYLAAAGGISGDQEVVPVDVTRNAQRSTPNAQRPAPSAQRPALDAQRFHPQRDDRFHGSYNFEFPPHVVYSMPDVPADERNLALLCKRTLEMDVPEMMASFMTERANQPWEFYRDYSRQLWDEARHAMLGSVAFEARGVDWKREIPLNVSFALRLNLHAQPVERQMMLYAIEQSLMPGETGKRYEHETAVAAGDELSAHFHDYDWADEVLHAQIGRRVLKREGISSDEAREAAQGIHERTWAALEQYKHLDAQHDWWPAFVRRVLGKESAATARPGLNIFSE